MNEYNRKRRLPFLIFVIIRIIVLLGKRQYCCELNQFDILLSHELFKQRRGKRDLSVFLVYNLRKRACLP